MAETPATTQHTSVADHHEASRKRQRSPGAIARGDLPRRVPTPPRLVPANGPGAAADSPAADGRSTRWQAARQRFAATRWGRGCFHLPLFPAPPPMLAPQPPPPPPPASAGTPKAPPRPHAAPPASVLGPCPCPPRPMAQGRGSGGGGGGDAGVIAADRDPAAVVARYLPLNPWTAMRGVDLRSPAAPSSSRGTQPPSFLAPPVMVRLDKWNAYWAAYAACCADELEELASRLRDADATAASGAATAAYRCVHVALNTSLWLPALPPPPADGAWEAAVRGRNSVAAGVLSSPSEQRSPSVGSTGSSAPSSSSYSYASSYSTTSFSSSYGASRSASTRSDSGGESELPESADGGDARAAAVAALAPHALIDLLYHAAHDFGAIEHFTAAAAGEIDAAALSPHQWLLRVQFTTATAAGLFWRWVDGVDAADIVEGYRRETTAATAREAGRIADPSPPSTPRAAPPRDDAEVWWDSLATAARRRSMRLAARLVLHDPSHASAELLLGPNVLISTPLVRSLFEGLFAGTSLDYQPALRGFRVRFASTQECRLALHALQCSLWRVFGVSLLLT